MSVSESSRHPVEVVVLHSYIVYFKYQDTFVVVDWGVTRRGAACSVCLSAFVTSCEKLLSYMQLCIQAVVGTSIAQKD